MERLNALPFHDALASIARSRVELDDLPIYREWLERLRGIAEQCTARNLPVKKAGILPCLLHKRHVLCEIVIFVEVDCGVQEGNEGRHVGGGDENF